MDQQNQQQTPQQPVKPSFNLVDLLVKIIPVLVILFAVLAGVAFLYYFIMGIVDWARYDAFTQFVDGIATGVARCGFNVFFAAVLAALSKIIKK